MRKVLGPALGLILAALVGVVSYLNQSSVTLNLWFQTVSVPLWLLIGGLFLLGVLAGILFLLSGGQRNRERLGQLETERDEARNSREQSIQDTRRESEAERIRKDAEIEGLHTQIPSLEEQVKTLLPQQNNIHETDTPMSHPKQHQEESRYEDEPVEAIHSQQRTPDEYIVKTKDVSDDSYTDKEVDTNVTEPAPTTRKERHRSH